MRRRLPSLTAVRAFEASARLRSFTLAAEELNVTQAAISHQVKVLEERVGSRLFDRQAPSLALTADGAMLADAATKALDELCLALDQLRISKLGKRCLTVSVSPFFGQFWLAPRLERFWSVHPNIELRLHHCVTFADENNEADVVVRLGPRKWSGVAGEYLMSSGLSPFCSPSLLRGPIPLRDPADLRHHTLLHAHSYDLWKQWLKAAGIENIDFDRGPIIDDPFILERAAIDGRGVALCPLSLLGDYLADGRLVRPFGCPTETDFAFHVLYPPGVARKPEVRAFRDFLIGEIGSCPVNMASN